MTVRTLNWCSEKKYDCGTSFPTTVNLCVAAGLVASPVDDVFGFIEATVDCVRASNTCDACGPCKWIYTISYDDEQLVDGRILAAININDIICGCWSAFALHTLKFFSTLLGTGDPLSVIGTTGAEGSERVLCITVGDECVDDGSKGPRIELFTNEGTGHGYLSLSSGNLSDSEITFWVPDEVNTGIRFTRGDFSQFEFNTFGLTWIPAGGLNTSTPQIGVYTLDGFDTGYFALTAANQISSDRSSYVRVHGNEHVGSAGVLALVAGAVAGGDIVGQTTFSTSTIRLYPGDGTVGSFQLISDGSQRIGSANNSFATLKHASVLLSGLSGASVVATNLIPAKATYRGCVARVVTTITGATSWDLGDGTDVDRWGAAVALSAGTVTTEANFTAAPNGWSSSAISPTLTANGGNFTGGAVRLTVFYEEFDGPTS